MKSVYLFSILVAATQSIGVSAQTAMDKTADAICTCAEKMGAEGDQDADTIFETCMMEGIMNNLLDLMAESGAEMTDEAAMNKLGEDIALLLFEKCPSQFGELALSMSGEEENGNQLTGKIVNIDKEGYMLITLATADQEQHTLLLLSPFFGANQHLPVFDGGGAPEGTFTITYRKAEYYDPRVGNFRIFKEITGVEKL